MLLPFSKRANLSAGSIVLKRCRSLSTSALAVTVGPSDPGRGRSPCVFALIYTINLEKFTLKVLLGLEKKRGKHISTTAKLWHLIAALDTREDQPPQLPWGQLTGIPEQCNQPATPPCMSLLRPRGPSDSASRLSLCSFQTIWRQPLRLSPTSRNVRQGPLRGRPCIWSPL